MFKDVCIFDDDDNDDDDDDDNDNDDDNDDDGFLLMLSAMLLKTLLWLLLLLLLVADEYVDQNIFFILLTEGFLAEEPSVYVQVSWDMSWRRFCLFIPLFRDQVSRELIEMKSDNSYEVVNETRIRLMNDKTNCAGEGSSEDAVVEFFVSKSQKDLGASDVNRNITIRAYKILHDYWKNKKMVLLDPIFLGKVELYCALLTMMNIIDALSFVEKVKWIKGMDAHKTSI